MPFRRCKSTVPPIRPHIGKQVPTPLLDIRCDVGARREQALRGREWQDYGWRIRILRSYQVAEVMRPAECKRVGGMSSQVSTDYVNRIRSPQELSNEARPTRTRLRVV